MKEPGFPSGLDAAGARGALLLITAQGVAFAASLLCLLVLARALSPDEFGLMAMATTIANLVFLFRDSGLSAPVLLSKELNAEQIAALHRIQLKIGFVLALLTIAVAPAVAVFYAQPRLGPLLAVLAAGFPMAAAGAIPDARLRRQLKFGAVAVVRCASAVLALICGVVAAWMGWGVWSLVTLQLVELTAASFGARVALGWRPMAAPPGVDLRPALRTAARTAGAHAAQYLTRHADNVLIGWYWGGHALGLYDQAYRLLLLPMRLLAQPLQGVLIPLLSELADRPDACRAAYQRAAEKAHLLSMPLACLMMALPDDLVRAAFGRQWIEAVPVVPWLGLAMVYQPLAFSISCLLASMNRSDLLWRTSLWNLGLSVASFLVALPYGPAAVAASYAIVGAAVRLPLLLWQVGKAGPLSAEDHWRPFLPALAAGALLVPAFLGLKMIAAFESRPLLLVGCAALVSIPTSAAALALLPAGRGLLRDSLVLLKLALFRPGAK